MRIPVRGTVKQCLHRAALTLPAHINTVRRIENTFPVQIMEHRPSAGAKPRIQVIDKFLRSSISSASPGFVFSAESGKSASIANSAPQFAAAKSCAAR